MPGTRATVERRSSCSPKTRTTSNPRTSSATRAANNSIAFFGQDDPPPMSLVWHHLVFDPEQQIGAAEYTYRGTRTYHGDHARPARGRPDRRLAGVPVPIRVWTGRHSLPATASDRPTLRQNLRGMPRAAWVLFAGAFVNRLGTFVLPFITLYLTSRGYSVPQAGLGLAGYGLGAMGAQALGGLLADRWAGGTRSCSPCSAGAVLTLSLVWVERVWADRRGRAAARASSASCTGRRRAR